ncbi:winged helix-turn-helix domain-containing protein [Cellulosimicrobium cellulans]|uniref:winged helix-turn-helix domain-containing protein n=1 Tax=Cellulosimicrobium cellulans TaxID=1710 RepID=UPI0035DEB915
MTTEPTGSSTGDAAEHHPRHTLDEVIHSPVRLSVVAALSGVEKADFKTLRDTIELSDPTLSKQLTVLEAAGYVEISKERSGRRARTWVRLTGAGRAALGAHLDALRAIADLRLPPMPPPGA